MIALLLLSTTHSYSSDIILLNSGATLDSKLTKIVERGIKTEIRAKTVKFSADELNQAINSIEDGGRAIIIGSDPYINTKLDGKRVVCAIYGKESDCPGVKLEIDPVHAYKALKQINQNIKKVQTVVTENTDPRYIERLQKSAQENDISLEVIIANGADQLAQEWKKILTEVDVSDTAILIADTNYMKLIGGIRHILNSAWKKKSMVITTIPSYTSRGISIGAAIDLKDYGSEVSRYLKSEQTTPVYTTSYTPAINLRQLTRAGYSIKQDQIDIKVVYIE